MRFRRKLSISNITALVAATLLFSAEVLGGSFGKQQADIVDSAEGAGDFITLVAAPGPETLSPP